MDNDLEEDVNLNKKFQWGKCANCNQTLTEQTTVCVLIYPEEFCSRQCVDIWSTNPKRRLPWI